MQTRHDSRPNQSGLPLAMSKAAQLIFYTLYVST